MDIYTGTKHFHHSLPISTENDKRISFPLKMLISNGIKIIYIEDTNKPTLDFVWKYKQKKDIRNCFKCTFTSSGSICDMCGNELKNYFNYVSKIDGDTTYLCKDSEISVVNTLNTIETAIKNIINHVSQNVFLLIRPPGHHNYDEYKDDDTTANGFCLVNNIIYGIDYLFTFKPESKVVIIDWDAHRANGTQNMVAKRKNIYLFDMFQIGIFPFDENKSNKNTFQFPLTKEMNVNMYIEVFEQIIEHVIKINPDYILISCGFDAHKLDTMSGLSFTNDTYKHFAKTLKNINIPTIYFLEGGYLPDVIYENTKNIIDIYNK
jgi:acetoin utilization deacetylase AcuC-like enzyme